MALSSFEQLHFLRSSSSSMLLNHELFLTNRRILPVSLKTLYLSLRYFLSIEIILSSTLLTSLHVRLQYKRKPQLNRTICIGLGPNVYRKITKEFCIGGSQNLITSNASKIQFCSLLPKKYSIFIYISLHSHHSFEFQGFSFQNNHKWNHISPKRFSVAKTLGFVFRVRKYYPSFASFICIKLNYPWNIPPIYKEKFRLQLRFYLISFRIERSNSSITSLLITISNFPLIFTP